MRTIRTKVYQFSELSESAKQKAIEQYRNNEHYNQHYFDEIIESVKAVCELFNLKTGREWSDIRTSHIDDSILELKGVRLYKYLVNNYYGQLFTPKYIKLINRRVNWKQFICKVRKGLNGEFTQLYSKNITNNYPNCALTGICYDDDILQPVYDFLKRPDLSMTFEDLMQGIESAINKTFRDTEEWLNSDEFITDEIEANEYEFKVDGTRF